MKIKVIVDNNWKQAAIQLQVVVDEMKKMCHQKKPKFKLLPFLGTKKVLNPRVKDAIAANRKFIHYNDYWNIILISRPYSELVDVGLEAELGTVVFLTEYEWFALNQLTDEWGEAANTATEGEKA